MRATANPLTGRSGATPDVELVVQRAGEHNAQEVGLQQRGHDVVRGGLLAACAPHGGGGSGSDIMADGRGSTLDSLLVHCTGGAPVVHSKAFMPHWCKSLYEVTYLFA